MKKGEGGGENGELLYLLVNDKDGSRGGWIDGIDGMDGLMGCTIDGSERISGVNFWVNKQKQECLRTYVCMSTKHRE